MSAIFSNQMLFSIHLDANNIEYYVYRCPSLPVPGGPQRAVTRGGADTAEDDAQAG